MNNNEKKGTYAGDDWVNNEMYYRDIRPTVALRESPNDFEFIRSILTICISLVYNIIMIENWLKEHFCI